MSFAQQTDAILTALRTVIGTAVIVDSASIAIRHTPETDLFQMPAVTAANYPLVALTVLDESPGVAPERESAKLMSVGVTVAMHTVVRYADVDAHPTIKHPATLARKTSQAINAAIGATADLASNIIGQGGWQGGGQVGASREALHEQGLASYTGLWRFDYGTDRP